MKAVLHYIFLVGMPILGVFLLLRIGSGLQSPAFVGGDWLLTWNHSDSDLTACANIIDSAVPPLLTIFQSGPHLILELNNIEKTSLKARLNELTINTDEREVETAVLQATVDRQSDPDQISGTLTLPNCPTALSFTGIRQPLQTNTTGGH